MAEISLTRYALSLLAVLLLLLLSVVSSRAKSVSVSSFSFKRFDENPNPSGESEIALMGDARVVNGGSAVEITRSGSPSAGRVMYKRPIRVFDGNPREPLSFSTYFLFSISPGNGDGLAFVFFPSRFDWKLLDGRSFGVPSGLDKGGNGVLIVEFDTSMDAELGDPNGNHVGVDLGSLVSVRVTNVSEINLKLNSGEKLQSWIDYDARSRRLEVRLCGSNAKRPFDPLISYPINLLQVWKDEEVFLGISSSSGNSSQISSVYSWSFRLRRVPAWLHSEPLDPHVYSRETKPPMVQGKSSRSSTCSLRILSVLIFGTACGALVFFVLFLWATFANRRHPIVVPKEYPVHPVEFGYEKMKPVAEKVTATDDKK